MSTKAVRVTELDGQPLYKVVDHSLGSGHGGTFAWSDYRPVEAWSAKRGSHPAPGAWTPKIAEIELCDRGYHLTTDPAAWMLWDASVFRAEGEWPAGTDPAEPGWRLRAGDKAVFQRVRLLDQVPAGTFQSAAHHALRAWWERTRDGFATSLRPVPTGMRTLTAADLERTAWGSHRLGLLPPVGDGFARYPSGVEARALDLLATYLARETRIPHGEHEQLLALGLVAIAPAAGSPDERRQLEQQATALRAGWRVVGFDADGTPVVTLRDR